MATLDQQEAALAEVVGPNAAKAMLDAVTKQYGEDTETFYMKWQDVLDAHGVKPKKPAATAPPAPSAPHVDAPLAAQGAEQQKPEGGKQAAPPPRHKLNPKPAAAQEGARTHVDGGYARESNDVIEYLMAAMPDAAFKAYAYACRI